jgi:hypothetical protein
MSKLDSLVYTVTGNISSAGNPDCWHTWHFEPASHATFDRAYSLYSQGHKDYAFFELFRYIETQLKMTLMTLEGVTAKLFGVLAKVAQLNIEGKSDEAERFLESLSGSAPSQAKKERVEHIINELKEKGFLNDGEAFLLHALRDYRNEVGHSTYPTLGPGMYDALILLAIPLIRNLEEALGRAMKRAFPQPATNPC